MNLPNKLTLLRVCVVPFFVLFLMVPQISHHYLLAGIVFGAASYTDHLDGKLARKSGQITNFGKFMDPLADKILVSSALICFVGLELAPVWMVLLIIFREFMISFIRLIAAEEGKVVASNIWGKVKTVTQIVAVSAVLLLEYIQELLVLVGRYMVAVAVEDVFWWIEWLAMLAATGMSVFSGAVYLRQNFHLLNQMK